MKKILFPFEIGNPLYKEAYIYAVKFARNMQAELVMLNVFNFEVDNSMTKDRYNLEVQNNCYKAYSECVRLNNFYIEHHMNIDSELNLRIDHRFVFGKLLVEIKKILKEETVDLVVIPVSDKKEINKKQLEIIRDDIFEKNRAALLIVPRNRAFKPISNIVFATDLKKLNLYELYLNDVLKYAKVFNSRIHFLHISQKEKAFLPEDTDAYRTMMQIIESNKTHVFKSLYGKDIVDSIQQYIQKNEADLLVVVKHERFFLDTLFHNSLSEELSMKSKIPLLIMREKEA